MPRPWKPIDIPDEYRGRDRVMMQCPDCLERIRAAGPGHRERVPIVELGRERRRSAPDANELEFYVGTCPECQAWFLA